MTLEEFKDFVKTGKPLDTEEIHQFMDKMGGEARKITFRLNSAYHTPEEIRDILSELFGKAVPATLRVFPPFYTDFGKNIEVGEGCVHQCLLPFSGPWRHTYRGRMPDRAQRRVCHAEPRLVARRPQEHLSGIDCAGQECVGRLEFDNPARRDYRRQCSRGSRGSRDERCAS